MEGKPISTRGVVFRGPGTQPRIEELTLEGFVVNGFGCNVQGTFEPEWLAHPCANMSFISPARSDGSSRKLRRARRVRSTASSRSAAQGSLRTEPAAAIPTLPKP